VTSTNHCLQPAAGLLAISDLEVVAAGDGRGIAVWRNLVIAVWSHKILQSSVAHLSATMRAQAAVTGDVALIQIFEPDVALPDEEVRGELIAMLSEHERRIRCSAVVFTGTGFYAAAVRAMATGITQSSGASFSHAVFPAVPSALVWVDRHFSRDTLSLRLDSMTRALEQLRACVARRSAPAARAS
jgi:hypothetical protein